MRKTTPLQAPKERKGKPPLELLPPGPLEDMASVLGYGAAKYHANSWRPGLPWTQLIGAALRHIFRWLEGEDKDPESGFPHLAHAATNLLFLLSHAKTGAGRDDRWRPRRPRR